MCRLFSLIFVCIFSLTAFGQSIDTKAIDSLFIDWDKKDTPGCAIGIMQNGALVYAKGYGMANLEYNIPNSPNSVFRIGSTSKQFTAACIILLEEQGQLSLDDKLNDFFPDFPAYAEKITVKHLLNHTSGIRDYLQLSYLKGIRNDDYYVDEEIMDWLINQQTLNFEPGSEYLYSNSGYWLLGQIVQKVSGMNMAEFAKQNIFDPLKMSSTHFHNDHTEIVKNRASGYYPKKDSTYMISMTTLDMIGDGGIFTTIEDIKKWDDSFYGSKILSQSFWNKMIEQGKLNDGTVIDYAAGLYHEDFNGIKSIRHGGAFVGFRADLVRFPDEHLSIAVFCNRGDGDPSKKADQIASILLSDQINKSEIKAKPQVANSNADTSIAIDLSRIEGDYEVEPGVVVSFTADQDSLNVLQNWNNAQYSIYRVEGNTFKIPGEESISFKFSNLENDKTQDLSVFQGQTETKAKRKEPIDISKLNMEDFVGQYCSEELDICYHFSKVEDQLMLQVGEKPKHWSCTISDIDVLALPMGLAKFEKENEQIVSFILESGRVKNVKFIKE